MVEVAVATAPEEVAAVMLEPPKPESAPVPAPSDVGTPALAERNGQVQEEAPGPRVAQQETPGPRVAQQEVLGPRVARQQAPGPRVAQQGSPEAVPVYQKNLQRKDRQTKVAESPGQARTGTPTRGQGKV